MSPIAFLQNKYYTDDGMRYVFDRLAEEFCKLGVELTAVPKMYASYPQEKPPFGAAVFWDKDVALGYALERCGVRLFNSAATVEKCDDKQKTFAALDGIIPLPPTLVAPLVYDVNDDADTAFTERAEQMLGYPVVVKECVGSQGRQVYLAEDRETLLVLRRRLLHTPHVCQKYIASKYGRGCDTRVYIVGGRAVGAVERQNTTDFRSNVAKGGHMRRIEISDALIAPAEQAAAVLGLEYGSVDFIHTEQGYVFVEANTSAYMQNAERLGISLAAELAAYVTEAVYGNK